MGPAGNKIGCGEGNALWIEHEVQVFDDPNVGHIVRVADSNEVTKSIDID